MSAVRDGDVLVLAAEELDGSLGLTCSQPAAVWSLVCSPPPRHAGPAEFGRG
jgi:hypothetical protein